MEGSVHTSTWPDADELRNAAGDGDPLVWEIAAAVLSELRGAKSAAKVRMGSPIESAVVTDTAERIELFALAANDVAEAGKVETLTTQVGDDASVDTTIVPQD